MNTVPTHAPAVFAWAFFAPGVLFIAVDVIRLNITGVFVLGVVFLILWAFLIGVFSKEFWVADRETSARLSAVDEDLDRIERSHR